MDQTTRVALKIKPLALLLGEDGPRPHQPAGEATGTGWLFSFSIDPVRKWTHQCFPSRPLLLTAVIGLFAVWLKVDDCRMTSIPVSKRIHGLDC